MADWRHFCAGALDVEVNGDTLVVRLGNQRQQKIEVMSIGDAIELSSLVARPQVLAEIDSPAIAAWSRNRAASLVGFRIDERGRLVGESWVPTHGLAKDEFLFYVRGLAAACDLFEFQLTGKDRE